MNLLKKITLVLLVSLGFLGSATVSAAGYIENQTRSETEAALDKAVSFAEQTLVAIESNEDKTSVMKMFKEAKQLGKNIQSGVIVTKRDRTLSRISKARSAFKKGNTDKAALLMAEVTENFKEMRTMYYNF